MADVWQFLKENPSEMVLVKAQPDKKTVNADKLNFKWGTRV
jgi:hypothetical protein